MVLESMLMVLESVNGVRINVNATEMVLMVLAMGVAAGLDSNGG